jgi:hypothetical protein
MKGEKIIAYKIIALWDEWLIFGLGNSRSEYTTGLPFEGLLEETAPAKLPQERKLDEGAHMCGKIDTNPYS